MKASRIPFRRQFLLGACALAFAAAPSVAAASWGFSDSVQGSGNVRSESRQVANFTGVDLGLPGSVQVRIGNSEGVTIEADDNLLPLIETQVENGTLRLRPTKRNLNLRSHNLKIVVTARNVERLRVGGSGSIASDALRGSRLEFTIGGSGSIDVKGIEAETAAVKVGGSGDLKVGGGNTRALSVSIAGSGDVDMGRVKAGSVNVKVAGSGDATVWAQDSLNVSVAGSGDVNYYGEPRVSQNVVGSGSARKIGAAPR